MTREEFKALLAGAANPDTAADSLTSISDGVEGLFSELEAASAKASSDAETINQLRDSNMRLFLRVSGTAPDDPEPDHEETVDEMKNRLRTAITGQED